MQNCQKKTIKSENETRFDRIILISLIFILIIVIINSQITKLVTIDYVNYIHHTYAFSFDPYYDIPFYSKYPGFYFIFVGFIGFLGIHTIQGLKLVYGLFDFFNVFIIAKISRYYLPNLKKNQSYLFGILYFLNPIHIYSLIKGENDFIGIFFLLIAFYYFLIEKYHYSAIFLGFGVMFKIFPIFFLIPISIYFLNHHQIKKGIQYWFEVGLVFILTSIPFLLTDFEKGDFGYFRGIFLHTHRMATGNSYAPIVSDLYNIVFTIGFIQISYLFLIQILILSCFFIGSKKMLPNPNKDDILLITILTIILSNYIILQDNHLDFCRFLPFLIIFLFKQNEIKIHIINQPIKFLDIMFLLYFINILLYQMDLFPALIFNIFYGLCLLSYFIVVKYCENQQKSNTLLILLLIFIIFLIAQIIDGYNSFQPTLINFILLLIRCFILYPILFWLIIKTRNNS